MGPSCSFLMFSVSLCLCCLVGGPCCVARSLWSSMACIVRTCERARCCNAGAALCCLCGDTSLSSPSPLLLLLLMLLRLNGAGLAVLFPPSHERGARGPSVALEPSGEPAPNRIGDPAGDRRAGRVPPPVWHFICMQPAQAPRHGGWRGIGRVRVGEGDGMVPMVVFGWGDGG